MISDFSWVVNRLMIGFIVDIDKQILDHTLLCEPRLRVLMAELDRTAQLQGCNAEVGCYRGGSALLIASHSPKPLYVFDTFSGLPMPSGKDSHKAGDFSGVALDQVRQLLPQNALIFQGIFPRETGFWIEEKEFAFVHLDCDLYHSVLDSLEFFWPRLAVGGVVVLDDYNAPTCKGAKDAADKFFIDRPEKIEATVSCQAIVIKI